jgi:hypothetical protein
MWLTTATSPCTPSPRLWVDSMAQMCSTRCLAAHHNDRGMHRHNLPILCCVKQCRTRSTMPTMPLYKSNNTDKTCACFSFLSLMKRGQALKDRHASAQARNYHRSMSAHCSRDQIHMRYRVNRGSWEATSSHTRLHMEEWTSVETLPHMWLTTQTTA